jgi:N-acetylglucosamine-6-sulfatase
VLKSCKGNACREPWNVLHPTSKVRNLKDALAPDFDTFYEEQPKVRFDECALGYIREVEGPQEINVFDEWENENVELKKRMPSFVYQGDPHLMT